LHGHSQVNIISFGIAPLCLAAWHSTVAVLDAVLSAPGVVLEVTDSHGDTVVHYIVSMKIVRDREAKVSASLL
jgi:hypothetical protein